MMGYGEAQNSVMDFATDLQGNIEAKKDKRLEITEVRTAISEWPSDAQIASGTLPPGYSMNASGEVEFDTGEVDASGNPIKLTKTQMSDSLEGLETELSTIGDLTEMMQHDLQNAMQQQAQFMQTMSNIMKMLHDTAKAIIGNLRA